MAPLLPRRLPPARQKPSLQFNPYHALLLRRGLAEAREARARLAKKTTMSEKGFLLEKARRAFPNAALQRPGIEGVSQRVGLRKLASRKNTGIATPSSLLDVKKAEGFRRLLASKRGLR